LVHHTFINAQCRKIEKDKIRVWRGNVQRKRLHILRYPAKLVFRGWEEVLELLTYTNCKDYIMWCHIDKKFPSKWHKKYWKPNKTNFKFCLYSDFT
jgi:hypothetical protein